MTLCVAWRFLDKFCLASDSCVTIGAEQRFCGIKVVQVPVRVISTTDAQTNAHETVFQSVYGLGFSGDFSTAYFVKETISEMLFFFQYLGRRDALRFEQICEVAFKAYSRVIGEMNGMGYGHDVDVILMGTCPASNRGRSALFFRDDADGRLKWRTVLDQTPFSFVAIGAGKVRFEEVFAATRGHPNRTHFAVLESLQAIAEGRQIPSVGGAIQYGQFEVGGEFRLRGIVDYEVRNQHVEALQLVRGMDLRTLHQGQDFDDLFMHYAFIDPFTAKRDRLLTQMNENR